MPLASRWKNLPALFLLSLASLPAQAQSARIRGEIVSSDQDRLTVRSQDGSNVTIALEPSASVARRVPADISAVHEQDFVGVTALPYKGDELKAVEVFVFPPNLRGVGEGHRPWDLLPESTMTNATVAETVDGVDGKTIRLTYKGGTKTVVLTPATRFLTYAEGSRQDLQPGRRVFLTAQQKGDLATTSRVTVEDHK